MTSPILKTAKLAESVFWRDGVRGWFGLFTGDIWVKPTEVTGEAEEAHRRWPERRSEQGARKVKVDQGFARCRAGLVAASL
jgi:hypothetical protein